MKNKFYFDTKPNKKILDFISEERKEIGFYELCHSDVTPYEEFAKTVNAKDIVVIGIGGSALGTSAIYKFLKYTNNYAKTLHVLETTDPIVIGDELDKIDLKNAFFCVISKSGTTVETISVFKYIASIVEIDKNNCTVITDEDSLLEKFAQDNDIKVFHIPHNVGGRFSVLSAVGLVPLCIIGVDIKALLAGAKKIYNSFFNQDGYDTSLLKKATYYAQTSNTYNINCLFSYSEVFREFNAWYVQLWGESLGKKQMHSQLHVGLTPVGLIGPTDQHSFLQLIVDGKRDKSVTVIKINNFDTSMKVPNNSLKHLESLDILNGLKFSELINMQADSIIESLASFEHIPLDVIEISQINEESMGELIYYYELLTALVAKMLDINAYDQPGVEMGKVILKEKLKGK
ncbi:glucose-6-phosphate isomerase [Sulfurimonas sp. HSL-1716]|uniref:glucose-6-phosphate isomerase n=1 Tax=Hydrocurvibacter sulfurireducens TaxID=3131937 RepID=UPI0031F96447